MMKPQEIKNWRGVLNNAERLDLLSKGINPDGGKPAKIDGVWAIPNDLYHSGPGISKSGLDLVERAPRIYCDTVCGRIPRKQSEAMNLGSAVHALVLEPSEVGVAMIAVAPDVDRRTKDGKAAYAEFLASSAGKIVLSPDEYARACGMAQAVHEHPIAGQLFSDGIAELSFFYTMPGRQIVKCRPDYVRPGFGGKFRLVDLKTTSCARAKEFRYSCIDFRYDVQAAFYSDLVREVTGTEITDFTFVAVEKEAPYLVACYKIEAAAIVRAREAYRRNLLTLRDCIASDIWLGYPTAVQTISL